MDEIGNENIVNRDDVESMTKSAKASAHQLKRVNDSICQGWKQLDELEKQLDIYQGYIDDLVGKMDRITRMM